MRIGFVIVLISAISAAWLASACTEENETYDGDARASAGDAGASDGQVCTPFAFIKCTASDKLLRCNSDGTGTFLVDCGPFPCDTALQRCGQCEPGATACEGDVLVTCSASGVEVRSKCAGGCQDGKCLGCVEQSFFLDGDGDGFGNRAQEVRACAAPDGYVTDSSDCDDTDPAAHPGQKSFFTRTTKGTGGYDFNCDKTEEKEIVQLVSCVVKGGGCAGDGWVQAVAACGQQGTFGNCTRTAGHASCDQKNAPRVQACR